jgi:hypothetical protein
MRALQVVIFCVGVLSFLAAIFFIGAEMGDTLWRMGMAFLLIDLVCVKLWPTSTQKAATSI